MLRKHQNTRARKFNRKLSGFQYFRLTQYIKYKAALAGIKAIQVSEAMTIAQSYSVLKYAERSSLIAL
jgi:IS605 OrfB family transposase